MNIIFAFIQLEIPYSYLHSPLSKPLFYSPYIPETSFYGAIQTNYTNK